MNQSGPAITIVTVNFNSSDFLEASLEILTKLTFNPWKAVIIDNGSTDRDLTHLQQVASHYQNVEVLVRKTDLRGSIAHGTALNELTAAIDTPYFCILDADAYWLRKDWDRILIERLTKKTPVIGTQADGTSKPQDFPLMYAILFETSSFKPLQIDFRPGDLSKTQDTGWEIREKYLEAGYTGEVLTMKNTRVYKEGPFRKIVGCSEYYLEGDSRIFTSHFGRGSNPSGKSLSKLHIPFLTGAINRMLWNRDKRRWITISKEIAAEQLA